VEGENILIEVRRSLGGDEELRALASELAAAKVELIVAYGTLPARVALRATTLPLVFASGNPIDTGLATSFAKPGGNGTGVSTITAELTPKRLEILKVAQAVRKTRLPAIFPRREYHEEGVLMSYGPNAREVQRKLVAYVDKILKGAKPSDLPIEEMSKYELVIDLRVAHELGIEVPQELLLRADEVIR